MELVLTKKALEYAVDYIKSRYPYCEVGMVGRFDELKYALEKGGNKVSDLASKEPDGARVVVAVGGDEEIDEAKSKGLPYVVLTRGVPLSAFQEFGIYNFQKVEYGYPNLVIFDNSQDEFLFQAEVRILLLSIYLECLSTLGSGLKGERQKRAKNLMEEMRKECDEFRTQEELLEFARESIEALGGLTLLAFLNKALSLYHPTNTVYAKFYAVFSLLYLTRRFTNIDFWVILPYMDEVRVRMLAEAQGIDPPRSGRRSVEVAYLLSLVEKYIPTEEELVAHLNAFRVEAGVERVDLDAILSALIMGATFCPKKEMVKDIVESGYLDALIS